MKIKWYARWREAKEAKVSDDRIERNRITTELEEFCKVGGVFYYLGFVMLCTSHRGCQEHNYGDLGIRAEYVNPVTGKIVKKFFDASHLHTLREEHARCERELNRVRRTAT